MNVNEYRRTDTRWVSVGQLFFGTMSAFALAVLYALFAWLEG